MEKVHDVIIIGAGISGIGASLNLSKFGIEHIILQARDKIGGRVAAKDLDGTSVQLGANYVHSPDQNNKIAELMKKINWHSTTTMRSSQHTLYQGTGEISEFTSQQADSLFEKFNKVIEEIIEHREDVSIAEASQVFLANLKCEEEVFDTVKWKLNFLANVQGGYLTQLSARDSIQGQDDMGESDIMPNQGFSKLVDAIYHIHEAEIKLNQSVLKIDYSSDVVGIYTKDNVFQAKRVISSLPLGILQSGLVQFSPLLPQSHAMAIHKIGNGVTNKLIISFEEPFWDESKHYINFITNQTGKYLNASILKHAKTPVICVFLSKTASLLLDRLSDEEIVKDFIDYLSKFNLKTEVKVRAYEVTRWHKDPFALGSYSFVKVGTTPEDFKTIRSPINDRLWFVGQHCHPTLNSVSHAAFQTGLWAAEEIQKSLKEGP